MKSKLFIIVSLFLFLNLFANSDVRILSSSKTSITFEYTPEYSETVKIDIEGKEYLDIPFKSEVGYSDKFINQIFLKYRNISIGVPSEFGNTLQIISTQHSVIKGKIAPLMGNKKTSTSEIKDAERNFKNKELVRFGDFGYSRDFPLQDILISPIQYDVETDEIKLYNKIVIRVNFGIATSKVSTIKDDLLKGVVLNFDVAKNWGKERRTLDKSSPKSLMTKGTWYRFEASEEGIYKISRSELASLGIDAATVNPKTIKIFSNGGFALNEKIPSETPYGLIENAIYVAGEEDGSFGENDYILFYGRGTDFWEYNSTNKIGRYHNPFSHKNYYWISFGGANGKRMEVKNSTSEDSQLTQTTTVAFKFLDEDKINIGRSGRDFWGDDFYTRTNSRTYLNTLDGRDSSYPIKYSYRFAVASSPSLTLYVSENGTTISTKTMTGLGGTEYAWGRYFTGKSEFNNPLTENRSVLKFNVPISSPESKAYLDYYEIEYVRDFKVTNNELLFFANDTNRVVEYKLSNFSNSNIKVFDVTNFSDVKEVTSLIISGGELSFSIIENSSFSKYIAVANDKYKPISEITKFEFPESIVAGEGAEYIIITDKKFTEQANRLAEYRQNESPRKLSTKVVFVDDIFNEFSNGMMDPTAIRNFLKYGYDNWNIKPFYVLLFGDGDYDYFNVEEGDDINFVPTYQSKESLNTLASYPMDDYYGRISGNDEKADLAIGRLNIQTESDAENVVNKIIAYEVTDNGLWKNLVTFVADDGLTTEGNDYNLHTGQSERLARVRIPGYMEVNKLYLAAYPTVITGFGRRKPDVNQAIITAINQGTLIVNYIGHGNPDVWAHESVFERTSTIPSLKNDKYFFLTAATCDFGLYDDPTVQSSTEELMLAVDRGMIGGFTAARVVYANANDAINHQFYSHLLSESLEEMSTNTVGKAFYLTKRSKTSTNDEKFHLFGDPAISLNIPKTPVTIEKVNNENLVSEIQLKALSKVSIEGVIRNYDNTINTSYNGEAVITVYDSDRIKPLPELGASGHMVVPGGVIFRGRATVSNGNFKTNFTVPQDISYENRNGKITAYINDEESDGIGYTKNITIGGTDSTVVNDGNGPDIYIAFDNGESSSATLVNEDFTIVLNLEDETGLNTTGSGIGHKLKGVINDNTTQEIDFTNHFVGDLDAEGKSGEVNYKITDFELGEHKIEVTAWDVFNNPSQQISYFTVVNSADVVLKDVVNYPNPFSANTTFIFQHNITDQIDVKIKIYTISGRLIKNIEEFNITDKYVKIGWDGRDEDGSQIASGTYLYKVIIKSVDGTNKQNVLGKLSIIH
ncbi:MAG: type IX secretion system sortase PorU [Melioribacteraceae bacterium]|nr:type IX secretion system sortase PorU [Melioribacteraceae bacterium]